MDMNQDQDLEIGLWLQDVPYYIDGFKRYYSPLDSEYIQNTIEMLNICDSKLFCVVNNNTNRLNGREFPHELVQTLKVQPTVQSACTIPSLYLSPTTVYVHLDRSLVGMMSVEQLATGFLRNKNMRFFHSLMNNNHISKVSFIFYCENENISVVCDKYPMKK